MEYWKEELRHHGILGMKWGKRNGPPYPLRPGQHSKSEKKAGWRKSLSKGEVSKKKVSVPKSKVGQVNGGLTDKQKKALIIGATALAIGGAAIMGYKLHQLNTESQMYMAGVRSIRNMITTSNETIANLANSSNVDFGAKWVSEKGFIEDISDNINKLPDVSKNPFVSADNKNTVKNLRKDVTNLYKNLGNADTARTNSILNEIKNESTISKGLSTAVKNGKYNPNLKGDDWYKQFKWKRLQRVSKDGKISTVDIPEDISFYKDKYAEWASSNNGKSYDYWYDIISKSFSKLGL